MRLQLKLETRSIVLLAVSRRLSGPPARCRCYVEI